MPVTPRLKTKQQPGRAALRRSRYEFGTLVQLTLAPLVRQHTDIDFELIAGPARGGVRVVFARHLAMYLAVIGARLNLTEAASVFARDRRAVAFGLARLEQRRDSDASFDDAVDNLTCQFRAALDGAVAYYRLIGQADGAGA